MSRKLLQRVYDEQTITGSEVIMDSSTLTKQQAERLRKADESYKEIKELIAPYLGKRYKRVEVSEEWTRGDRRLVKTAVRPGGDRW